MVIHYTEEVPTYTIGNVKINNLSPGTGTTISQGGGHTPVILTNDVIEIYFSAGLPEIEECKNIYLQIGTGNWYSIWEICGGDFSSNGFDKIIGTPINKWANGYTTITGWQYGYLLGKREGKIKLHRFLLKIS